MVQQKFIATQINAKNNRRNSKPVDQKPENIIPIYLKN
jgi:hypothetical protein